MVEAITLAAIVGAACYALGVSHERDRAQADWENYMGYLQDQRDAVSGSFKKL